MGQLPNGAEIDVVSRDHEGAWLAIPGTGYVFYKAAWIELDRDVSDVPKRTRDLGHVIGPLHGAGTRTGVPAVDAVVEAVTDGDLDRLSELLVFEEMPCTLGQEFYLDPPLCPAGEPAGTPVAVMPFSANHPGWLREFDRERIVGSLLLGAAGAELTPPRLYGVARAANQRWYTYAAIFAFEPSGVGYFFGVTEHGIEWIGYGESPFPATQFTRLMSPEDFVLPPRPRGPASATVRLHCACPRARLR